MSLTARLDNKDSADLATDTAVEELREKVNPLTAKVGDHEDRLSKSEKQAELLAGEIRLIKQKQTKTEANVSSLASAPCSYHSNPTSQFCSIQAFFSW